MVEILSVIGLVAAVTSAIGFVPQVMKTWKTKKTRDLSIYMIATFLASAVSWTAYGVIQNDIFIWSTNSFILVLSLILLYFKLRYKGD